MKQALYNVGQLLRIGIDKGEDLNFRNAGDGSIQCIDNFSYPVNICLGVGKDDCVAAIIRRDCGIVRQQLCDVFDQLPGIAEMMRARFGGGSSSSRICGGSSRSSRSCASSAALAAASRVVAISEERTNSLVVSAPSDVIPTIERLVKEMDRTIEDVTELQVFKLQYADAYETADLLTSLFSDKDEIENSRGGYRFGSWGRSSSSSSRSSRSSSSSSSSERMLQQKRVVAVADPRTNSVIVSATAELMSQIALMIERLDDNKSKQQKVFTYSLEHADVEGVSAILRSMFEQQNGNFNSSRNRSSQDQQNPLDNRRVSDPQSSGGFSSQQGR